MSSSCLTKAGVQEICNPPPESPVRLALQAEILHRYHQGGFCSPALRDMTVPMGLSRLFASYSLQLRAVPASHWLSFLHCA